LHAFKRLRLGECGPAPGLKEFLERLWEAGVSEGELTRMVSVNSASLLSLN
jgi:hypothetical protein